MCEGLKVELRERVMALNILTPELDSLKVRAPQPTPQR